MITGDEMHYDMTDRLTGCLVDIDAYVVAIGMVTLVYAALDVGQHHVHRLTLVIGQVEVGGNVTLRNDQA
jgi:hypothetical protein